MPGLEYPEYPVTSGEDDEEVVDPEAGVATVYPFTTFVAEEVVLKDVSFPRTFTCVPADGLRTSLTCLDKEAEVI